MASKKKNTKTVKRSRSCPECAATEVVPIIHGIPTRSARKLMELNQAVQADREEWEGLAEWHCNSCGCDWSRHWRRFKIPGGVNATQSDR